MDVDIRRWWFDRQQLRGGLRWGVTSTVFVLAVPLGGTSAPTAAFQEETLSRGVLQGTRQERYGRITASVGQAATSTPAHLGYYPVSGWPPLLVGIVAGWLVDRRGSLRPAGIAHGSVERDEESLLAVSVAGSRIG